MPGSKRFANNVALDGTFGLQNLEGFHFPEKPLESFSKRKFLKKKVPSRNFLPPQTFHHNLENRRKLEEQIFIIKSQFFSINFCSFLMSHL